MMSSVQSSWRFLWKPIWVLCAATRLVQTARYALIQCRWRQPVIAWGKYDWMDARIACKAPSIHRDTSEKRKEGKKVSSPAGGPFAFFVPTTRRAQWYAHFLSSNGFLRCEIIKNTFHHVLWHVVSVSERASLGYWGMLRPHKPHAIYAVLEVRVRSVVCWPEEIGYLSYVC